MADGDSSPLRRMMETPFERRGHAVYDSGEWFHVYCFAKPEDADKFKQRFGGVKFDPADRGKGRSWARWNRP